jgi:hypothetical protein
MMLDGGDYNIFHINIAVSSELEVKTWLNEIKEKTAVQYGKKTRSVKGGGEKCFEVVAD